MEELDKELDFEFMPNPKTKENIQNQQLNFLVSRIEEASRSQEDDSSHGSGK
jgi:hypothetical protein